MPYCCVLQFHQRSICELSTLLSAPGVLVAAHVLQCSATCGVGAIWRSVRCSTGIEQHCTAASKPVPARRCSLRPCSSWRVGNWSKVSRHAPSPCLSFHSVSLGNARRRKVAGTCAVGRELHCCWCVLLLLYLSMTFAFVLLLGWLKSQDQKTSLRKV